MNIIGANLGKTESGMLLNDGGICLLKNDKLVITSEERISRNKYAGGFEKSLYKILEKENLTIEDIDLFVFSSCCELPRTRIDLKSYNISDDKIVFIPSHHLSHAYSTFFSSEFDQAIIMVIDNEGNIIKDYGENDFYKNKLEHMTYYIGNKGNIEFLERENILPEEIGVGDAYRYFTHYLGFPSYVYAGKTMGLSAYGSKIKYKEIKIFNFNDETGKINCKIKNNYKECEKAIKEFFDEEYGIDIVKPRTPIDDITQDYADLAELIQRETEDILIKKVKYLIEKTGIKNLCIAGGVGLNSVANSKILNETKIEKIFILPAAGDTGQCLGNVYYGYYNIMKKNKRGLFTSPYLGFSYTDDEIFQELLKYKNIEIKKYDDYNLLNKEIAKSLIENKIIARYEGKSEFGPRALGNRSILMSPMKKENKDILNMKVKFREGFRPFAPSVLEEKASEYFDVDVKSPYMLLVAKVRKPDIIPAVTHEDLTARLQTVSKDDNFKYYDLISEFEKLTGIPVLLNTSFNINGQPIVETPKDAIECFLSTNIDELSIGSYIVKKKVD